MIVRKQGVEKVIDPKRLAYFEKKGFKEVEIEKAPEVPEVSEVPEDELKDTKKKKK